MTRQDRLAFRERVHAFLLSNQGSLLMDVVDGLRLFPSKLNFDDTSLALSALRHQGRVRYVTTTSVPFDPVAKHCGWWAL